NQVRTELAGRAAPIVGLVGEPRLRSFLLAIADSVLKEEDWLVNICMNVIGRHPSIWSDDNAEHFSGEVRVLGLALRRVEAIHFAGGDRQQDAVRVTLTHAAGHESAKVIQLAHPLRERVADLVEEVLLRARQFEDPNAVELLVGLLTSRAFDAVEEPLD